MKNYVNTGDTVTINASEDVVSGQVVKLPGNSGQVGVAQTDAASGERVALVTEGAFEFEFPSAQVAIVGSRVFYNPGTRIASGSAAAPNFQIGVAYSESPDGSTSVQVKLNATTLS